MLTAKLSLADWKCKLSCHWADFACLSILSWHNAAGNPINDTSTAADASILKPVQDGAAADCRSAGVKFVQVQLELDYTNLATQQGNARPTPILRGEYYLQLPPGTANLTNANGQARCLTTFLGVVNLWTLSTSKVKHDLLDVTHQDGPYDLLAPNFNLSSCRTNSLTIYGC
jgi:hypothetical protein